MDWNGSWEVRMDNNFLSLLGLCHRAGLLASGEEPADAACRAREAKVLFTASDAAENTLRRARHFAENGRCPVLRLPYNKEELGSAIGRTSVAILAVTDAGFAAALAQRLKQTDSQAYGEAAEALEARAEKVLKRRSEQRAHEKKKQRGLLPRPEEPEKAAPPPPVVAEKLPVTEKRPAAGNRPITRKSSFAGKRPVYGKSRAAGKTPTYGKSQAAGKTSAAGEKPVYGNPSATGRAPVAGERPAYGKPTVGGKKPAQAGWRDRRVANPWAHSHPVKKGKGSFRGKKP